MTDPNGSETTYDYDDFGRLVAVDPPGPGSLSYTYNGRGFKVSETDEEANSTTYAHDVMGRVTSISKALGWEQVISYNEVGMKTSVVGPGNQSEVTVYDSIYRTMSYSGSNTGSGVFDVSGFKPTAITSPRGFTTTITYDELYRQTSSSIAYGDGVATTTTELDLSGNPIRVTDPTGKVTSNIFDISGNVIESNYADGSWQRFNYGLQGLYRTVSSRGTGGMQTVETVYDSAGRAIVSIGPNVSGGRARTEQAYDNNGNVIRVSDPNGNVTTTSYTSRNLPSSVSYPDGGGASTTYDAVGNPLLVVDARGHTTNCIV